MLGLGSLAAAAGDQGEWWARIRPNLPDRFGGSPAIAVARYSGTRTSGERGKRSRLPVELLYLQARVLVGNVSVAEGQLEFLGPAP